MEEKLLELLKIANTLDKKNENVYAEVEYLANHTKKLKISIRKKEDYSYVEECSVMLFNNPISKIDAIIKIFKEYIGGATSE